MGRAEDKEPFSLSFYFKQGEQGEQVASRNEKLRINN
jgi:hypothetical protein